jgi:hypothetical protein
MFPFPLATSKGDFVKNRRCSETRSLFIFLHFYHYFSCTEPSCANRQSQGEPKKSANSKPFRSASPFGAGCILVPIQYWRRQEYVTIFHSTVHSSISLSSYFSPSLPPPPSIVSHLLRIRHFYLKQRRQKMHRCASPLVFG